MRTIAAVLLCLIPAFSAAQINKCLDSSGKVVGYATDCPAGTRPEQTGISNTPGAGAGEVLFGARRRFP